ncbi:MAG: delta-60 repeat domain-containing protein [Verrucomicrobiales bacterium]
MKTPHLFLAGFARIRAFLLAAASPLCLLAPPAHAAPGDLDATFGTGGKVTTDFGIGSGDEGVSVALQSDGKIVVAGSSGASGNQDFALVRYTSAGALDTSVNGTGKVTTDFGFGADWGRSVAVQSDGKIVVAGSSDDASGTSDFALVRYTSTGALDTSFNGTGKVTTPIGSSYDWGQSVAVQSDGRIVVAGYSRNASGNADFALVRYTSTGALDTSFNGTGKVTTDFGGDDYGYSVALQSDGKIVVAGDSDASDLSDIALVRYTSAGALDTSFNGTGKVTTDFDFGADWGTSVAVQSDGKIVVAGESHPIDFALVRFTSTGALDTSFNGTGHVTTDIGSRSGDGGQSVSMQNNDKIVVAGYCY